jgi:hypothetical protein
VAAHARLLTVTGNELLGRRIIGMGLQRRDRHAHPVIEWQRAQQAVHGRCALGAVEPDRSGLAGRHVPLPQPDQVSLVHERGCGGRLSVLACRDFGLRSSLGNVDFELDEEVHRAHDGKSVPACSATM